MLKIFSKLLDFNQKEIDKLKTVVAKVNACEKGVERLVDNSDFAAKTAEFKNRLTNGETLSDLLPEAFALAREASRRAVGLRPYDVQIMAATVFHEGRVSEQRTGEGKTLSAVPALYLNALTGKGVHLVTVNDYLARRDAGWNGPTFALLGMTVGIIVHDKSYLYDSKYFDDTHGDNRLASLRPVTRREAYAADITYGTNNEFGFDYLRDNMVQRSEEMVQRGHHFAVVDEVDSILIDEARTPLIISAPDMEPTQKYYEFAKLVNRLNGETDYVIDEKHRTATLTEIGLKSVEKILGITNLYEKDFETIHHMENALKAKTLYNKDREYIVKENQVIIVDEFTGRLMPGRRWSEGMHQAVEAKENVVIQQESKTLATISFQNYFRMYEKLAGMTGTAATEAEELRKIYKLEVIIIPTNKQNRRIDHQDTIYKNTAAKYEAMAAAIAKINATGQPVLVGTTSIDKNEIVSSLLKRKGVVHQVLNAKNHEKEASIIAEAGRKSGVTIATNIAGRGVDIILGGSTPENPKYNTSKDKLTESQYKKAMEKWQKDHDEVVAAGGLYVIGTERHESRRVDNQLRGRSGRQGDPGATKFFLSLEDDIMRIFGGDAVAKIMNFLKIPENEPIEHGMVTKSIEQAQIKVEGFNFDARKQVVDYDDVMNKQREIVYRLRYKVLSGQITTEEVVEKTHKQIDNTIAIYAPRGIVDSEVLPIVNSLLDIVPLDHDSQKNLSEHFENLGTAEEISKNAHTIIDNAISKRVEQLGEVVWKDVVKFAYLSSIDNLWIDHLDAIDDLRSGIGLRGYGQRDPLVEYKSEAFGMFERLVAQIESEFCKRLFRIQVAGATAPQPLQGIEVKPEVRLPEPEIQSLKPKAPVNSSTSGNQTDFLKAMQGLQKGEVVNKNKNIGRNDPCWCGSGKKYKHCHYPN